MTHITSIPGVVDATPIRGAEASRDGAFDLVIEVPHGATRTSDFTSLQSLLKSPLPESLSDFFHVNTDAGAPELAEAIATRFVTSCPTRSVLVLRCRVPRTFIDCNRRIDAAPEDFKAGKVTPGLMPWITHPDDRALLRARYDAYTDVVRAAIDAAKPGGAALMMHTYAPRTVDVEVDEHIVKNLRRAYEPEVEPTWPLRPELDVIGRSVEGVSYAPAAVVEALAAGLAEVGLRVADSETYPMHPSTMAWHFATTWEGRTLCLEVRRDLVADPFEPFAEMRIGAEKVARLAAPIARAVAAWW